MITNAEIMRRYQKVTLPWREGRAAAAKKRILLVSPRYNTHIVAPHLGLGYLAASVRRAGHDVVVMDGLREEVKYEGDYDLVGISAMTTYFPEAVWETKRAKAKGLPVIIGGPHVIADPVGSLEQSGADFACDGEGEIALASLLNGTSCDQIPGLVWREGSAIRRSQAAVFYPDIDDFGEPAWDLIDPRTYPPAPHGMIAREFPLAPIITTRGCPYKCSYCSAPITAGKKMRYRDPKKVVDEIERLVTDYGVKEIQIEDDNFTLKRDHVLALCQEIRERKIHIQWSLPNGVRIDRLDKEMLREMKRAGCYLMALGIESANERILNMVDKHLKPSIVRGVVEDVVEAGIEAWGFFMIGFPTETRAEIENTVEFALSLPLSRLQFTKTTPLPGTPIYDWWREKIGGGTEIDWSKFNYYEFDADWSEVSAAEIGKIQRRAHFAFYSRPRNFFKIARSLRLSQYRYALRRLANLGTFRSHNMPTLSTSTGAYSGSPPN